MGVWDKFSEMMNNAGINISGKAKNIVSLSSLQSKISVEESKIENTFAELGKKYYEMHHEDPMCQLFSYCEKINASKIEIDELKKEIEAVRGLQRCPSCGGTVAIEAKFCPECGFKMPEIRKKEQDIPVVVSEKANTKAEVKSETAVEIKSEVKSEAAPETKAEV